MNDSYKDKVVLTVLYLKFCTELSQWHRFSSKQSSPEGTRALITHAWNALSAPNSVTNCTVKLCCQHLQNFVVLYLEI